MKDQPHNCVNLLKLRLKEAQEEITRLRGNRGNSNAQRGRGNRGRGGRGRGGRGHRGGNRRGRGGIREADDQYNDVLIPEDDMGAFDNYAYVPEDDIDAYDNDPVP